MRLADFRSQVMGSFVRNRLINDVYLNLVGANFAKQMGVAGEAKRTDLMGLLLLVSPPGYGKTTLMEYIANRLGLTFMKINGPAIGHMVTSLDPSEAPNATAREELKKLCSEAAQYKFASVCVNAANVAFCARELRGSGVPVCAVVGFPLGATTPNAKAFETREAVRAGASEIDMVINIGALKSRDYALLLEDITKVVEAAKPAIVKVIIETCELTRDEKVIACALSKVANAAFVKTSTGFGPGGATAEDVALMKLVVGDELQVKASGGMRTSDDVDAMIKAGATRIGASASIAIVQGAKSAPGRKRAGGSY